MKTVNIEEAKKEFIRYVDNYELTKERISLKKYHSLRVMEISTKIAQEENFTEEEVEIATLIGLLHDIARFKQYTDYETFKDHQSFDHGDVGVEILEKDNFLRKFIKTDKYDEIIKLAIKNHNKFAIEEGLTEEQNKFCKLVRDADKIDILFIGTGTLWRHETEQMENSILNPEIKEDLNNKKLIQQDRYEKIEYADSIIRMFGYMFDVNYKSSFKLIKKEQYIDRISHRFKFKDEYTQKEILDAAEQIKQYMQNKIEE